MTEPLDAQVDPITGTSDTRRGCPDAEVSVLAGAFLDVDALRALLERGRDELFTHPHRTAIFRAIRKARDITPLNGVDPVAVMEELRKERVQGAAKTLSSVIAHPPVGTHWSVSLDLVERAAHERDIEHLRKLLAETDPGPAQDAVIDRLRTLIADTPGVEAESLETLEQFAQEEPDPPVDELIAGVLARGGVNVIYGPSGSCKSWAAMDLALAAVSGAGMFVGLDEAQVTLPHDGKPDRVLWLYGSEDSRRRVKSRFLALAAHHPMADLSAIATRPCPDLDSPSGLARLRRLIAVHEATIVFVDTVSSATSLDLGDATVVKPFITALQRINDDTGAMINLLHHARKASSDKTFNPHAADNLLGSVQWRNLCAGIILVHAQDGDVGVQGRGIDIVVVKSKDLDKQMPRARVHWDHENHCFIPGETPSEEKRNDQESQQGAVLLVLLRKGPRNVASRYIQGYGVPAHRNTRNRRLAELVESGYVEENGATGNAKLWSLTPKGEHEARKLERVEQHLAEHPNDFDGAFDAF